MNRIAQFARIFLLCIACTPLPSARAAPTPVPDKRDGQVLDALLLHLLSDPKFNMRRTSTNGATIVLHAKRGGFWDGDWVLREDGHTVPTDAERDLQRRNSPPDATEDTSFTNLTFSARIVVADLTGKWIDFADFYPTARGYVRASLPGYSKDGTRALIHANVGPAPHGATMMALLEKNGDKWLVKWHHITWYG